MTNEATLQALRLARVQAIHRHYLLLCTSRKADINAAFATMVAIELMIDQVQERIAACQHPELEPIATLDDQLLVRCRECGEEQDA